LGTRPVKNIKIPAVHWDGGETSFPDKPAMHEETVSTISPPVLVYLGMGIFMARIILENTNLRSLNWLARAQFLVQAGSIILLWPLVLFIEKLESWLKPHGDSHDESHS
jgi:hypothetical protein